MKVPKYIRQKMHIAARHAALMAKEMRDVDAWLRFKSSMLSRCVQAMAAPLKRLNMEKKLQKPFATILKKAYIQRKETKETL